MEEIGVFPLLRPSVYLIASENLKGQLFDSSGRLITTDMRRIVPPSSGKEDREL
jgi:hypothetical protein